MYVDWRILQVHSSCVQLAGANSPTDCVRGGRLRGQHCGERERTRQVSADFTIRRFDRGRVGRIGE